jgi:hypothetical protein
MLSISSFFERFRSREIEEINFCAAIIDVVKEVLRYDIKPSLISYSNNIIFLKISPAAKSAVMLEKTEILEKIKEKTKRKVVDIR